jgi:hypothetical protein
VDVVGGMAGERLQRMMAMWQEQPPSRPDRQGPGPPQRWTRGDGRPRSPAPRLKLYSAIEEH